MSQNSLKKSLNQTQDLVKKKLCVICRKKLNKGKIYCSLKCYWQKSPKFKTNCKQCDKEFYTYQSFIENGEGFLCSKVCKYKWISEQYKGINSKAGYKNAKVNRICKWCNKKFQQYKSKVALGRGIFCTNKCYKEWFRKYRKGNKALRWIDGSSFLPYGFGFTRKLKKYIKERDNWTCQKCASKEKLSVHHINYDKNDNSESNLITLCITCNIKDISINKYKYVKST